MQEGVAGGPGVQGETERRVSTAGVDHVAGTPMEAVQARGGKQRRLSEQKGEGVRQTVCNRDKQTIGFSKGEGIRKHLP